MGHLRLPAADRPGATQPVALLDPLVVRSRRGAQIVEEHGGTLQFESAVSTGTTVVVSLPEAS